MPWFDQRLRIERGASHRILTVFILNYQIEKTRNMGSSCSKTMALALDEEIKKEALRLAKKSIFDNTPIIPSSPPQRKPEQKPQEALRLAKESPLDLANTPIVPLSPRPKTEQKPVSKCKTLFYPIPKEFKGSLSTVPEMHENIPTSTVVRRCTTPLVDNTRINSLQNEIRQGTSTLTRSTLTHKELRKVRVLQGINECLSFS